MPLLWVGRITLINANGKILLLYSVIDILLFLEMQMGYGICICLKKNKIENRSLCHKTYLFVHKFFSLAGILGFSYHCYGAEYRTYKVIQKHPALEFIFCKSVA